MIKLVLDYVLVAISIDDERLDAMFAALADRTRRDIVVRPSQGEATVKELAAPYSMSLQAVSWSATAVATT